MFSRLWGELKDAGRSASAGAWEGAFDYAGDRARTAVDNTPVGLRARLAGLFGSSAASTYIREQPWIIVIVLVVIGGILLGMRR